MKVFFPTALLSYTQKNELEMSGATSLADLMKALDDRFPGFRFRIIDEQDHIREHIKIFVNREQASNLNVSLGENDHIQILTTISGG